MIIIPYNPLGKQLRFGDLRHGDVFRFTSTKEVYIKTDTSPKNALRLRDGYHIAETANTLVTRVIGSFVEKGSN